MKGQLTTMTAVLHFGARTGTSSVQAHKITIAGRRSIITWLSWGGAIWSCA